MIITSMLRKVKKHSSNWSLMELETKKSSSASCRKIVFWIGFLLVQAILLACLALLLYIAWYPSNKDSLKESSDWGANVTVGGNTVSVLSWFDDQMSTNNIKNNLQYE